MNKQFLAEQLTTAGLIACLPTTIPLQDTFPLIDSLLASPVFAVVVLGQTLAECDPLVTDLRQRGGDNFVVGALVQDMAQVFTKTAAQFVIGTHPPALSSEPLYIPLVRTLAQAEAYKDSDDTVVAVMTADIDFFQAVVSLNPQKAWIPFGSISFTVVPEWQTAGAKSVGAPVWFSDEQLMPETITLARRYNRHFHQ